MDLLQLKYFVKIVEHRSFTKAARDCNVSQPALSQQIRKLERQLGQPILERKGRTVHLTAGGQLLLERAQRILKLVADTESQITDDGETGRLSISAIPTIGPYFLPSLLQHVKPQFPKARFLVGEDVTEVLSQRCLSGEIDVGILALPSSIKRVHIEPLFNEELYVALAHDHPLAGQETISDADVRSETFVLLGETHCLTDAIEGYCDRQEIQPVSTARIQQLETVKQLVALGQGISFIPEMATGDDLGGRLVYRQLKGSSLSRTIAICWNPARYQSQLFSNFVKAIRELADANVSPSDDKHAKSRKSQPLPPTQKR